MDQENTNNNGQEERQESLEDKLLRIVKAGIGMAAEAVEKSKEAISGFASKENVQNLANRGEQTLEQVKHFSSGAIEKVKKTLTDADIMGMVKSKSEKLRKLAQEVHGLSEGEREVFNDLLSRMDSETPQEDGSLQSDESFEFGRTEPSERTDFADTAPDHPKPAATEDEANTVKIEANDVNEHIQQNVPPEY